MEEQLLEEAAAAPSLLGQKLLFQGFGRPGPPLALMIPKVFSNLNGSGILNDSGWALGLATFDLCSIQDLRKHQYFGTDIFSLTNKNPKDPSLPHAGNGTAGWGLSYCLQL